MSQVITFEGYRPTARFDSIPWTDAQVYEAVSPSGPWTLIDTLPLLPVDADPANPAYRDFTTELASDTPALWYQIVFVDATGDTSQKTVPVQNRSGTVAAPCSAWLTGEDVALCCQVEDASDPTIFDSAAIQAQELLFELSGRRFNGICSQTVRPCQTGCGCAWQVLSRGHIVWDPYYWGSPGGWMGSWLCDDNPCGCTPLSRVPLAGYVQEIVEVLIDGEVVDPDSYRVDRHRWLVRQRVSDDDLNPVWPSCQNMALAPGEPGTWSVTYTYGQAVPAAGVAAATELACEIFKACSGEECRLPSGTTRVARQGLTIEKVAFTQWGWTTGKRAGQIKGWNTGMPLVDNFLSAFNPGGLPRAPVVWSPAASLRFPVPVTDTGT